MWGCVLYSTSVVLIIASSVASQGAPDEDPCDFCVENASCSGEGPSCMCDDGYEGDGTLYCFKPDERDICSLCDDPMLTTLSNDSVKLNVPKEMLLCDDVEKKGDEILRLETYLEFKRKKGQLFIDSYRVVFTRTVDLMIAGPPCKIEYRVKATHDKNTGQIMFRTILEEIKPGVFKNIVTLQEPAPKTYSKTHCNCKFNFAIAKGHVFHLDVECCDVKFVFRPKLTPILLSKSGLYISKPKVKPKKNETGLLPESLDQFPVCLTPEIRIKDIQERLGLPTPSDAMSFLALTNLPQDILDTRPDQANLTHTLLNCTTDRLSTFFNSARFMLESHPFIHCISGPGTGLETLVSLVWRTSEYFCEGDVESCDTVVAEIHAKCGHLLTQPDPGHAQLKAFVAQLCTTP